MQCYEKCVRGVASSGGQRGMLITRNFDSLVYVVSRSRLLHFFILERRERTKQFGNIRSYNLSTKQFVERWTSRLVRLIASVPLSLLIARFQKTGNSILAEQALLFTGKNVPN